jgi:hypothetical protein
MDIILVVFQDDVKRVEEEEWLMTEPKPEAIASTSIWGLNTKLIDAAGTCDLPGARVGRPKARPQFVFLTEGTGVACNYGRSGQQQKTGCQQGARFLAGVLPFTKEKSQQLTEKDLARH